jgi:hypothetical protein
MADLSPRDEVTPLETARAGADPIEKAQIPEKVRER